MRTASVFSPRSTSQASNGPGIAPSDFRRKYRRPAIVGSFVSATPPATSAWPRRARTSRRPRAPRPRARRGRAEARSASGSRRGSSRSPCAPRPPPGRRSTSGRSGRRRRRWRDPAPGLRGSRASRSPCFDPSLTEFLDFVVERLAPAPARVLEVGCGPEGGVTPALAKAGYDVLGVDPRAPDGPLFRRVALEELDAPGPFAAIVASRVLHHVRPLGPALDKLARLAPLLLLDEFAPELIDEPARDWYAAQYRMLVAAGGDPPGPADLGEWRD